MRPHELDPYLVVGTTVAPKHESFRGVWWDGVTLADLLPDHPPRSPPWMSAVGARLAVMSTGPVLRAGRDGGPLCRRLEMAGLLNVAEDADLNAARESAWPALHDAREARCGAGSLAPKLVLVGEIDPYDRIPFMAKSGTWLFRALRELGWDELSVYACNAQSAQKRWMTDELALLRDAFGRYDPLWIGLGEVAQEVLRGAGVEHVKAVHPSHARRFSFSDGPVGYAKTLLEAGVPLGPWNAPSFEGGAAQPVLPAAPPNTVLAERLALPLTVGQRINRLYERSGRVMAGGVSNPKIEEARRLYVTGVAESLTAAAKQVGIGQNAVNRAATNQNWAAERADHLRTIRERSKSSAVEAESAAVAEARQLSWATALLGLKSMQRQLQAADFNVRPQEVKALVDAAVTLRALGDPESDAERARLGSLTPQELVTELSTTMTDMFGEAPPEAKK